MGLNLYMIGLTVKDMEKSKEFYRILGVDVPAENPKRPPLMIPMGDEFTLFLAPESIPGEPAASGESPQPYRVLFEYYLKSQAAVEAKYAELIAHGYQSYRAPFIYL